MSSEMGHAERNLEQLRLARESRFRCPQCYGTPEFRPRDRARCHSCYEDYDLEDLVDLEGGDRDD